MKSPVVLIGVVLVVLATVSVSAQGVYYVAADGSDTTGDGSAANPWTTITHALDEDGDIDIVDIMLVVKHWGETCP